jgi:hypothetical protein
MADSLPSSPTGIRAWAEATRWRNWLHAAVLAASLTSSASARAQESDAHRAAARDLALQGSEAYDAGDYTTALDRFNRAAALVAAPTLMIMQARCLAALGKWIEALERYREIERLPLTPEAPAPFAQAAAEAAAEARALEERLPRVSISLDPPSGQAEVLLDGKPVPHALLNVEYPIDPGPHVISAAAPDLPLFEQSVTLAERQLWQVVVPAAPLPTIEEPTEPAKDNAAPARPPVTSAPREPASAPSWLAPVALSVGAAGLGTAIVAGILAGQRHTRLERVCTNDCPVEAAADLEAFRLYRGLFFAGGALAIVGAGVGTYVLVFAPDSSDGVALALSPLGAQVHAQF